MIEYLMDDWRLLLLVIVMCLVAEFAVVLHIVIRPCKLNK